MIQRMFVALDTKKTNYKNVGKINHGDDLILELTVLTDGDMISFNDPMVDLLVKKSDGKMIRQNSSIEHIKPNKFVIEVSKDCVTSPGLTTNQLVINDNGRISTCMFYYTILNSLEEDVIQSISSVEVLEQLDEYVIEARERMELLNNDINKLEEFFGATSDTLVEAEMARNEAEQKRVQSEILRVNNENDRIEADNIRNQNDSIRNQNEVDRSSSELVREQRESERILNEEERRQNESERMIDEFTRQQNENIRQSNESIRMSNETDRKTQENRRVTAETNRVNAETARRNNENSRISNESERQKAMNEMKSLLEDARVFDERVGVIEDEIEEINSKIKNLVEINLADVGCKFEEGQDDSDLIQKAINDGNIIVFPPNKIAYIKKPLYAKSNLTIVGNGSTIKWDNETVGLEDKGIIDLQQGVYNNVKIKHLIIDGNKRGNSHIPDHTYNTTSSNGMDCIRGGTINNLLIENCVFKDSQKMGIVINGYGKNITVLNSIVDKSVRDGMFIVGKNILISNCKIKNTRDNSIAFDCDFVEDTSKVGNFIIENCIIENTEKLSNECGIYIGGLSSKPYAKNFEIKGNTIIGQTYHGLIVRNVDTVNIHNNNIKDCKNYGGLTSHGLSLSSCKNIYINKNIISYNQGSGVQSKNNINTYLSDNIINNNTLTGIYIDSGKVIEIINNSLCDNGAETDLQCGNIVIDDISYIGSPQNLIIKNNTLRKDSDSPYYGISIKSSAINNVQIIENNEYINLTPIYGTYVDWLENMTNEYSYILDFSKAKKHKLKLYQNLGSLTFVNGCVGEKYTLILNSKGDTRTLNFGNLIISSPANTLNADCFSMYEIIFDGSKYICTNKVEKYF